MPHLILLGDSILDNGAYTNGQPPVIDQLRGHLPAGWKATLAAIDGSTTDDIPTQLAGLPGDATHLVLSQPHRALGTGWRQDRAGHCTVRA